MYISASPIMKLTVLCSSLVLISLTKCAARKDLYLMGLLPMTGDQWPGGPACLPALELGLSHVNARLDILPDYKLNLIWKDTGCDAGRATNVMYEMLYREPKKLMIIGPPCSVEAEVTAQASPFWNITHLDYGGASPLLSDRRRFPRFFRLVSPDTRYNLLRIAMAREFGWKRIATINPALDYFSAVTDNLAQTLQGTDISIISEEIFDHDPLTRLQSLKRKDARIIFSASYENHARRVMCAAYQVGLYGPKIVWMFPGWFKDKFWVDSNNEETCTQEQLNEVAEGSFLTGFFYYNINEDDRGIANLSVKEFYRLFKALPNYHSGSSGYEILSGNSYDAIWGAALTLNCTGETLKKMGHPKRLEDFDYSDGDIGDIMLSCLSNQSFTGISGNIEFTYFGDPIKRIRLDQIQGGKKVLVGVYRTDVEEPYLEWRNGGIKWKDGVPPRDSTLISRVEVLIPPYLYIIMSCFSAFGIALAVSFFFFNIVHRNHVYVKLSSPNINNVLLLGCIITYSYVFMVSLKEESIILCKLRTFTLTIGFSMAFGALFSKTWRVYRIFCNKKLLRLRIKDSQLIGIVLVLVGLLSFVLVVWEITDPMYIVEDFLKSEVYLSGNDAEVHPFIRVCTCRYHTYFAWAIFITEGLLLTFGAFLAFETRKFFIGLADLKESEILPIYSDVLRVKIAALNDSRLIGTCLYNVVVLCAVGLTLNLALQSQIALLYGIMSAILIIGTTATQLIVFIPKLMGVYYPHHIAHTDADGVNEGIQTINTTINARVLGKHSPRDPYQDSTTTSAFKPNSSAGC